MWWKQKQRQQRINERMISTTAWVGDNRMIVRLWIGCDENWSPNEASSHYHLEKALAHAREHSVETTVALAELLAARIPHLNAVEVLTADRNGVLIYPSWP